MDEPASRSAGRAALELASELSDRVLVHVCASGGLRLRRSRVRALRVRFAQCAAESTRMSIRSTGWRLRQGMQDADCI